MNTLTEDILDGKTTESDHKYLKHQDQKEKSQDICDDSVKLNRSYHEK